MADGLKSSIYPHLQGLNYFENNYTFLDKFSKIYNNTILMKKMR